METGSYKITKTTFAPILYMNNVGDAVDFYKKAFDAEELRRWSNPDGSVHVAEMIIDGALFHMHEEVAREEEYSPHTLKGTTVILGLFVSDVDKVVGRALVAGAAETNPAKDYEYGYRQATIRDPFGHHWQIQKSI